MILTRALSLRFLGAVITTLCFFAVVVFVFELAELIRRAEGRDVALSTLALMGGAKLPTTLQTLFPFVMFLSAIMVFWQMNTGSEIAVLRASGRSIWQIGAPAAMMALLCGAINLMAFQPLSAWALHSYGVMEATHLDRGRNLISLNDQGLWLRTAPQAGSDGARFLHAGHVNVRSNSQSPEIDLRHVIVIDMDADHAFAARIDVPAASMTGQEWVLPAGAGAGRLDSAGRWQPLDGTMRIQTGASVTDVLEDISEPARYSLWDLGAMIETLTRSGFPTLDLRLHRFQLMALPIVFAGMVLLALSVSTLPHRSGRAGGIVAVGILGAFAYFLTARYFTALALTQRLPELLAVGMPVILLTMIPVMILYRTEDS